MYGTKTLPEATRMALEALFKDVQDMAHEAVRDAHPGRLAPTHTTRYDTEADRTAARTRITDTLSALALTADITGEELAAFRESITAGVDGLYRNYMTGLRASIGVQTDWSAEAALVGVQRLSASIATLVVHPGAAVLLGLLDDVEDAFTSGASAVRLTRVLHFVQTAYVAASPGEDFPAFIAYATHYAALVARPDTFVHYGEELKAVVNGLTVARAGLAERYVGVRGREAVRDRAARSSAGEAVAGFARGRDRAAELERAATREYTGPVTLVIGPAKTTEHEKNARSYGNAYTRQKALTPPSAGDFHTMEAARNVVVELLEDRGAPAEDIAAARVMAFGASMVADGLHILIRETY